MRSYVATLRHHGLADEDGSGGDSGSTEGSAGGGDGDVAASELAPPIHAPPVDCSTAMGFGQVTPDHRYSADIYAFDRAGLVLAPREEGTPVPQVPVVIDPATLEVVEPRWTTSCPTVTARYAHVRRIHDCDALIDHGMSGPAAVELSLAAALGSRSCGTGSGEIERFEVTTPTGTIVASCDEPLVLDDVPAERSLVLPVLAFEAGATGPVLGTTCVADPHQGVTVTASCDAFTDKGALAVDPVAASAALGLDCTALRELTLTLSGSAPRHVRPSDCGRLVEFAGLGAGEQSVSAVATAGDGTVTGVAQCGAAIIPAQRALATCAPEP
jgi:hypothetical protein